MSMMDGVNVNALQFESSVMDGPVINSRAGLYIYINAMFVGRPLADDNMLLSFLVNRYGVCQSIIPLSGISLTRTILGSL